MVLKSFIAGAICSSCKKQDCVRVYKSDNKQILECVECGYVDNLRLHDIEELKELPTRVDKKNLTLKKRASIDSYKADVIKIID